MAKKIAVITGASGGIGKRFAETVERAGSFDEVWVIARRPDRLEALKDKVPFPVRALALDLTDRASFDTYAALLESEQPEVGVLINCSGFGKFCATTDVPLSENLNMVDLNCQALMAMCQLSLPYMKKGGHIINIASVAAYQPIPYINVYAASKAFVLSYSRSLNVELRDRNIKVMAFCPGWVKTDFFDHAWTYSKDAVTYYNKLFTPEEVVRVAMKDSARGKDVCVPGFGVKAQVLATKLLPHKLIMAIWMKQQKH